MLYFRKLRISCYHLFHLVILFPCCILTGYGQGRAYYVDASGNDNSAGSRSAPWKTLHKISLTRLHAGDSIFFRGGMIFAGTLQFSSAISGTKEHPFIISSYGHGRATILAGNSSAILLTESNHISILNLVLKGSGRKTGNTGKGLMAMNCSDIKVNNLEVSGFQKSGVELVGCSRARLEEIYAHDNGYAGISVGGMHFPKIENEDIYIGDCRAENNPGDPTELNSHSGNGIVVGLARRVMIEYCSATNNGWDMPRTGNGPVGIWAWQCDSAIIQRCISYRNKTAAGAMDGGGFDLDGGVTNSLVQYNLAYENQGYGYGVFQFAGATPWHHNTFRYNVSYNDGNTTMHGASILWWNGSKDSTQFHDAYIYQNLFYNADGYALGVIPDQYDNSQFYFLNNILAAKDGLMSGGPLRTERFLGNTWWSMTHGFRLNNQTQFNRWAEETGNEKLDGKITGMNRKPDILLPAGLLPTDPHTLAHLNLFRLNMHSPQKHRGVDIFSLLKLDTGGKDFFGNNLQDARKPSPGISD